MASVSSEVMKELDVLMVEGDLLQVDIDEQESLRRVLAACDSDTYGTKVFEFKVFKLLFVHCQES